MKNTGNEYNRMTPEQKKLHNYYIQQRKRVEFTEAKLKPFDKEAFKKAEEAGQVVHLK